MGVMWLLIATNCLVFPAAGQPEPERARGIPAQLCSHPRPLHGYADIPAVAVSFRQRARNLLVASCDLNEIESQVGWTAQLLLFWSASTLEQ
jgi:hypothetical protein